MGARNVSFIDLGMISDRSPSHSPVAPVLEKRSGDDIWLLSWCVLFFVSVSVYDVLIAVGKLEDRK